MQWIGESVRESVSPRPAGMAPQAGEAGAQAERRFDDFKVIRRNGAVVEFQPEKVSIAMTKAFLAVNGGEITADALRAGREALPDVVRYPGPPLVPSADYDAFIRSGAFTGSAETAAQAAATAAMTEKANVISTPASISDKAQAAVITALNPVFSEASRTLLTSLPMSGDFGVGSSGLNAEIVLPANHPTNPFRHRRHPDHTVGFDIRRLVSLTFSSSEAPGRAGYGVDRISGSYGEEIYGLHKPLGPSKDIGLRVRGTFKLNRISLIDTLNGR